MGDEVISIDKENIEKRKKILASIFSASTPQVDIILKLKKFNKV